jgi:DNA-binding FadR family transcriptional regulator
MRAFDAVQPAKSVAVLIGEKILAAINEGAFPVGSRLPGELELARQFGVSRPSIREALSALQFAGYIESRRGAGSVVVSVDGREEPASQSRLVSTDDAVDWIEARSAIEPEVMAIAAFDPDPDALKAARQLVAGMRLAVDEHAFHPTTDLRVHRVLADVCRNQLLADQLHRLLDMAPEPILAPARDRAWHSDVLPSLWARQHCAMIEAVSRRRATEAKEITRQHLASMAENIREALDLTKTGRARLDALLRTGALAPHPPTETDGAA